MADKNNKVAGNAPGKYYVDSECTACDDCVNTAPDFFKNNEDEGFCYVYKQPETDDEIELCEEALDNCPSEAIGNDGED